MKFIVLIPARGGSKRLPHKNILQLAGKPLIMHTIECALKYCGAGDIYVSTDDRKIIDVAAPSGVNIIERPAELAGDFTPTSDVLQHTARELDRAGVAFDYIILLQCTQPLRPAGMIEDAVAKLLEAGDRLSLVAVSPLVKKLGRVRDDKFIPWNYTFGQRSQDMEPLYYENGLIYITHRSLALCSKVIDENPYPYIVDHEYAGIDIDNEEDLALAERIIRRDAGLNP